MGIAAYNVFVDSCYNTGEIKGIHDEGGIVGYGLQTNVRYCYNTNNITGSYEIGGIIGRIDPFEFNSYTNNYIYYCYNIGKVTGKTNIGSINGYFNYCDIDYVYSLTGTHSSQWGDGGAYLNATNQGIYDKATLISAILSNFGSNFKSDYTGTASVNEGYPILSWQ